ncbi:MAG: hypothetical protein ACRDJF_11915 [Actinomycetota bacterium]
MLRIWIPAESAGIVQTMARAPFGCSGDPYVGLVSLGSYPERL